MSKSHYPIQSKISLSNIGYWSLVIGHFLILPLPLFAEDRTEKICDPIKAKSIVAIVGFFIKTIIPLSGAVALLMLIVGAIYWIISAGESEQVQKGKDTVVWALVGAVVILGSYVALSFIFKALTVGVPGYSPDG